VTARAAALAVLAAAALIGPVAAHAQPSPPPNPALDKMLADLKSASSEQEAAALEGAIGRAWINAGSAAVTLLMGRGQRDLAAGANQEALDDFDAATALAPTVAETWHRRALAEFALGDTAGAIRDIEETVRREPRHFAAFETLSRIAESRHDWMGAYKAWQKVLELDPKTPGGEDRLRDLRRRALGEET
jgi:tetratricopeptide (TPR) repeat protein